MQMSAGQRQLELALESVTQGKLGQGETTFTCAGVSTHLVVRMAEDSFERGDARAM